MHQDSLEHMNRIIAQYVLPVLENQNRRIYVVEIGAKEADGSFRALYDDPRIDYLGIDLEEGKGVDLVLKDPYKFELPDTCTDVVIVGQLFKSYEFFWLALAEMARILKPGGLMILIVPSKQMTHPLPLTCYQFLPNSLPAFARFTACELLYSCCDDSSTSLDLVAVLRKPGALTDHDIYYTHKGLHYIPFITEQVSNRGSKSHLEIGSATGNSIKAIPCASIAIDPNFQLKDNVLGEKPSCLFFQMESDTFFERYDPVKLLQREIDTAFLDGMHLFEFLLRDFINAEKSCHASSAIFLHDCIPTTVAMTNRDPNLISRSGPTMHWWTGDVWKVVEILKQYRPDLKIECYDCEPTGLVMVTDLNPKDTSLRDNYNAIVAIYAEEAMTTPRLLAYLETCQIKHATTSMQI